MKTLYFVFLALLISYSALFAQDKAGKSDQKIQSASAVNQTSATDAVASYDFTTSASKYYGGAEGAAILEINGADTTWGMIAGDADQNGGIGASDLITVRSSLGSNDYNNNDIDMNAGVGSSDLILIRQNLGKSSQLP
jgi:hypothetical protein